MDKEITIKINNKKLSISILSVIAFLYFSKPSFLNFSRVIGFSLPVTTKIILIPCLLLLIYYTAVKPRNICWDGIALILLALLFFYITIKLHPEYEDRYNDIYNNGRFSSSSVFKFGAGIYCYYIIRLFKFDSDKLYKLFSYLPFAILFLNIGRLIIHDAEYRMDFGYQMEIVAMLFLLQYLNDENSHRTKLYCSIIIMFLGVIYGARASIIGYIIFILLFILWKKKVTARQFVLIVLGLLSACIYNSQSIMTYIYNWILNLGINSRTLYLIASGDIMSADTSRQDRIWPLLINYINELSFFNIPGAYTDRYLLPSYYPYAHNIFLEIIVTFGKCFGGILIISIILLAIISFKNKNKNGALVLVFGSFSISRLFFSSSIWIEPYFWAFLAIMINSILELNKEKKSRIR